MEKTTETKKTDLLTVSCIENGDSATYQIKIAENSSVSEAAFCMACVVRTLVKDGYIENANEIINLIKKYATDSAYDEVPSDK